MMLRRLAYCLLAAMLLGACSSDNNLPVPEPVGDSTAFVNLCINVAVNNPFVPGQEVSRAINDMDSYFEEGIPPYEQLHSLRVILVNSEDSIVEYNEFIKGGDGVATNYIPNISMRTLPGGKRMVYLIANESGLNLPESEKFDNYPKGTTFTPSEWVIESSAGDPFFNDGKTYVPMTESFEVVIPEIPDDWGNQGDYYMTPKNLFVTRTASKFTFITLAKKAGDAPVGNILGKDYRISKITVNSTADKEYLFPRATYNPHTSFPGTDNEIQGMEITAYEVPDQQVVSAVFEIPSEAYDLKENYTTLGKAYEEILAVGDEIFTYAPLAYFPETKLSEFTIDVTMEWAAADGTFPTENKNETTISDIKLTNMPYGLPRNTSVYIILTPGEHGIEATATLFPYTAVNLKPSFGFSVPVQSIHITRASSEVAVEQSIALTAYVLPDDANNKNIIWSSANPEIATVTNEGVVTGVREGTAIITATSEENTEIKTTCTVTVTPKISVTSVTLNPTTWRGNIGETINLVASIMPTNATNKNLIWTSSNPDVASVSSYGTVTAVNSGMATITVTSEDNSARSASCTVTVNPRVMVESVSLSGAQPSTFYQQDQFGITASVSPQNATNQSIAWTSSDTNVAIVSPYGLVTAVNPGTATITATAKDGSGKSASRQVTVTKKRSVTGVTISQTTAEIIIDPDADEPPQLNLTANIEPSDATYRQFTWTSSNPYVAVVSGGTNSSNASSYGTATITATTKGTTDIIVTSVDDPTFSAKCTVTVTVK